MNIEWRPYPDGAGYIWSWRPTDGKAVVVFASRDALKVGSQFQAKLEQKANSLREKVGLAEITQDAAEKELHAAVARMSDDVTEWANGL